MLLILNKFVSKTFRYSRLTVPICFSFISVLVASQWFSHLSLPLSFSSKGEFRSAILSVDMRLPVPKAYLLLHTIVVTRFVSSYYVGLNHSYSMRSKEIMCLGLRGILEVSLK